MVCDGLDKLIDNSITGILAFPNSCDYFFWGKIMFAFFVIITITLYRVEKRDHQRPEMASILGISSLATIFISTLGTLLKIIQGDVFIIIFSVGMIFIVLWLIKK